MNTILIATITIATILLGTPTSQPAASETRDLVAALGDSDEDVRALAAEFLGETEARLDPSVPGALAATLLDGSEAWRVRRATLRSALRLRPRASPRPRSSSRGVRPRREGRGFRRA